MYDRALDSMRTFRTVSQILRDQLMENNAYGKLCKDVCFTDEALHPITNPHQYSENGGFPDADRGETLDAINCNPNPTVYLKRTQFKDVHVLPMRGFCKVFVNCSTLAMFEVRPETMFFVWNGQVSLSLQNAALKYEVAGFLQFFYLYSFVTTP